MIMLTFSSNLADIPVPHQFSSRFHITKKKGSKAVFSVGAVSQQMKFKNDVKALGKFSIFRGLTGISGQFIQNITIICTLSNYHWSTAMLYTGYQVLFLMYSFSVDDQKVRIGRFVVDEITLGVGWSWFCRDALWKGFFPAVLYC